MDELRLHECLGLHNDKILSFFMSYFRFRVKKLEVHNSF